MLIGGMRDGMGCGMRCGMRLWDAMWDAVVGGIVGWSVKHVCAFANLRSKIGELRRLLEGDLRHGRRRRADPRICRQDPIHILPDLDLRGAGHSAISREEEERQPRVPGSSGWPVRHHITIISDLDTLPRRNPRQPRGVMRSGLIHPCACKGSTPPSHRGPFTPRTQLPKNRVGVQGW